MSGVEPKRKCAGSHNDLENKKLKSDCIEEQNVINFFSLPTLESISVINVAFGLCKQTIRDALVRKYSSKYDPERSAASGILGTLQCWELEESILNKLSLLPLPHILKEKMTIINRPVLIQILDWMARYDRRDIKYIDSVCWTVHGTMDKVKTFELLVKNDSAQQHINFLFEFACTCCLEDSIHNLWGKLPEPIQKYYELNVHTVQNTHLMAYWISIVKNDLSGLIYKIKRYGDHNLYDYNKSIYHNMIKLAMSEGNILAVKYFWNKLAAEEINSNLAQWINDSLEMRNNYVTKYQSSNKFSDVLYFLLFQIDCKEDQKDMFVKNSNIILFSLFLDWPWQGFLLPVIRTIWISLDKEVYVKFLSSVVGQIEGSKRTEKLLRQLWLESPINLKKHFIQFMINGPLSGTDIIFNLLAVNDVETVKLIINHATAEERKLITFSILKNEKLFKVIYAGKFCFFDTLLSETLSSDLDVHNFKAKIMKKYGNKLCYKWIPETNWEMVEKFLNWASTSQDQIDSFKNQVLDKIDITYQILRLRREGKYDLADHFLRWCFNSEQEILQFKKVFAKAKSTIVEVGIEDWSEFEKFLSWSFTSDQDINVFKLTVLEEISGIIFSQLASRQNFEFVDNLIRWCCHSADEIKQFKARFVFSDTWLKLLNRFVSNHKLFNSYYYSNWEVTQKLIKLFSPLDKEVIANLIENIKSKFGYDDVWDFQSDNREISFPIKIKHLFSLIENPCYTIKEDDNSDHIINIADDLE